MHHDPWRTDEIITPIAELVPRNGFLLRKAVGNVTGPSTRIGAVWLELYLDGQWVTLDPWDVGMRFREIAIPTYHRPKIAVAYTRERLDRSNLEAFREREYSSYLLVGGLLSYFVAIEDYPLDSLRAYGEEVLRRYVDDPHASARVGLAYLRAENEENGWRLPSVAEGRGRNPWEESAMLYTLAEAYARRRDRKTAFNYLLPSDALHPLTSLRVHHHGDFTW